MAVKPVVAIVVYLMLMVSAWYLVEPSNPTEQGFPSSHEPVAPSGWGLLGYAIPLLLALVLPFGMHLARRRRGMLTQAIWDAHTGREALARQSLAALATNQNSLLAAQARYWLAFLELDTGAFKSAGAHMESALRVLSKLGGPSKQLAEELVPLVLADAAVIAAARGRYGEARETLTALSEQHPEAPQGPAASARVELTIALRRRKWARAARLAATLSPELPLPLRDEWLVMAVLAVHGPESRAEHRVWLREELSRHRAVEQYATALAPELTDAIRSAATE